MISLTTAPTDSASRARRAATRAAKEASDALLAAASTRRELADAQQWMEEPPMPDTRAPDLANEWSAIDAMEAWDCAYGGLRLRRAVPPHLVPRWAAAVAVVFRRLKEAAAPQTVDRALKWILVLHSALLAEERGGRRGGAVRLTSKLELFEQGQLRQLLEIRNRIAKVTVASTQPKPKATAARRTDKVDRVTTLIAAGHVGKAARLIVSEGLADATEPLIAEQVRVKHPLRGRIRWR